MSDQRGARDGHSQGSGTRQDSLASELNSTRCVRSSRSLTGEYRSAVLHDLATLLNTGLNREQLKACVDLIEDGVGPQAVAVSP